MKQSLHARLSRRARTPRGFTLVEIMIVIMIAAMLLAIAVPNFIQARETSRARACQLTLWEIQSAKERWAMDNRRGATDTPLMTDLVVPGVYMRSMPVCPSDGVYTVGALNQTPTCSIGGTAGTRDSHVLP
jgi:prepilin-type N-terminal cleavage/methylation domain-containing protein